MADSNEAPKRLPPGIHDPARRALTHSTVEDKAYVQNNGAETNGEYTLVTCTVFPGGGTPLHYHYYFGTPFFTYPNTIGTLAEEQPTPTKGSLCMVFGNETKHFPPGETGVAPVSTKHRLFNGSDSNVEFVARVVPAHDGFEQAPYIIMDWRKMGRVMRRACRRILCIYV